MAIAHASRPAAAKFCVIVLSTAFACLSTSAQGPSGTPGTAGTAGAAGTSAPAGTAGTSSAAGTSQPAQAGQQIAPGTSTVRGAAEANPVTLATGPFDVVPPNVQSTPPPLGSQLLHSQSQARLPQANDSAAVMNGQTTIGGVPQFQGQTTGAFVPVPLVSTHSIGVGFSVTDLGLAIDTLDPAGVFFRSGLRRGDVIISLFGRPIQTEAEFASIAAMHANERIPMTIVRDGKQQSLNVTLPSSASKSPDLSNRTPAVQSYLGAGFNTQIPELAVVVWVDPGSPAEIAGLRAGDVLTLLNGEPVKSCQHAMQILGNLRPGDRVDIAFSRRVENRTRVILETRRPSPGSHRP